MTSTLAVAGARVRPRLRSRQADALRALAEAGSGPASGELVARLNPAYPPDITERALAELSEAGLVEECPHPLMRLFAAYSLTPGGRRWVRYYG